MELQSLIGKVIKDILVVERPFEEFGDYGLRQADCFFVLENELIVALPFNLDIDVWIRELDPSAVTYFPKKKWWQRKPDASSDLRGKKIIDIIHFPESDRSTLFELDNGKILTELTVAPPGIAVGLYVYNSIHDIENKFGSDYISLTSLI